IRRNLLGPALIRPNGPGEPSPGLRPKADALGLQAIPLHTFHRWAEGSLLSPLRGWGFRWPLILGLTPQALRCRPFRAGNAGYATAAHDPERNPAQEPANPT